MRWCRKEGLKEKEDSWACFIKNTSQMMKWSRKKPPHFQMLEAAADPKLEDRNRY